MSSSQAHLPLLVYTTRQVREFDRRAIEDCGIDGFELMRRAGEAALGFLREQWPAARSLLICCGAGNNAGDGYVIAALARAAGFDVRIVAVVDPAALAGAAARAVTLAREAEVPVLQLEAGAGIGTAAADVIVDALLGTGLTRDVDGLMAEAVAAINAAGRPVLALDVPTGLDSDTGQVRGTAVRADATVTFVGLKAGLYLGTGPDHCGRLGFSRLAIPDDVMAGEVPRLTRIDPELPARVFKPRLQTSHKGLNGRVLIVGGAPGMAGAARLAAEAALRSGAGLVHAAVAPESAAQLLASRPEIMCRGIDGPGDISDWIDSADVIVLGPGLGTGSWGHALFDALVGCEQPLVLDADGLNRLARGPRQRTQWVLTPHPGEAGRLLERPSRAVQAARDAAVAEIATAYNAIAVLKGACSLVAQAQENTAVSVSICDAGNPGMASAGMGDVLSGVLGGLIAQFGLSRQIVEAAVLVHAQAGDDAAVAGQRGMVASDLFEPIRRRVNPA